MIETIPRHGKKKKKKVGRRNEDNNRPAEIPAIRIADAFSNLISEIQSNIEEDAMAVDLELKFANVELKAGGIPIIASKKSTSSIEIRLATRIHKSS